MRSKFAERLAVRRCWRRLAYPVPSVALEIARGGGSEYPSASVTLSLRYSATATPALVASVASRSTALTQHRRAFVQRADQDQLRT